MNGFDLLIGLILLAGLIAGMARGTLRELWSLFTLAVATFFAGQLYPTAGAAIHGFVADANLSDFLGFAAFFVMILGLLNGPVDLVIHDWQVMFPRAVDRTLGGLLAVFEAAGVAEVLALLLTTYPVLHLDASARGSALARLMVGNWPVMLALLPPEFQPAASTFAS